MESDPVKRADDIEDVLSSIRRLVSEHQPATAGSAVERAAPPPPAEEEDRLVLTAALRVTDPDDPWRPVPRGVDSTADELTPDDRAAPAPDPVDLDAVAAALKDAGGDASSMSGASMPGDDAAKAMPPERGDVAAFAGAAPDGDDRADADPDPAAGAQRPFVVTSPPDTGAEPDADADAGPFSTMTGRPERVDAEARDRADEAPHIFTPDADEDGPAARTGSNSAPEAEDLDVEDLGEDPSPFTFPDKGFDELDEDTLREIIAEVVREELQGALGERITRNVRKMVRREIRLALAAEDLD